MDSTNDCIWFLIVKRALMVDNQDNQEWDMKQQLQYLTISCNILGNLKLRWQTKHEAHLLIYCEFMWIYGLMASTHVGSGDPIPQATKLQEPIESNPPIPKPFISGWWMSEQTKLYNIANLYIYIVSPKACFLLGEVIFIDERRTLAFPHESKKLKTWKMVVESCWIVVSQSPSPPCVPRQEAKHELPALGPTLPNESHPDALVVRLQGTIGTSAEWQGSHWVVRGPESGSSSDSSVPWFFSLLFPSLSSG